MTTNLLGLRAENFKRLTLVDVEFNPEGGVVAIMGANEAGKSSLLDALEVAIAGRKAVKIAQPVHTGEDSARVIATFDDIIVTRTYKANGTTTIDVKAADGRRVAAAEDLLRSLYSHVALDPLAFSRLTDAEQIATLLPLIGFDPEPLDREKAETFELRTVVNRDVKALEARLAAFPEPKASDPTDLVSVAELSDELARALGANGERERIGNDVARIARDLANGEAEIARLEAQISVLRTENAGYESALEEARKALASIEVVDVEPIRERIANAEQINDRVRAAQERASVADEHRKAAEHSAELTAKLAEIAERREKALAAAKMPVPGLSIDDDGVLTLNGVPFSQASTGVKIRTGTAIAMSLNPDLRLIVIRDASLLDEHNRSVIDELAKANGFTVLMEIADESMPVGVVIEDGAVREVRP